MLISLVISFLIKIDSSFLHNYVIVLGTNLSLLLQRSLILFLSQNLSDLLIYYRTCNFYKVKLLTGLQNKVNCSYFFDLFFTVFHNHLYARDGMPQHFLIHLASFFQALKRLYYCYLFSLDRFPFIVKGKITGNCIGAFAC